MSDKNLKEIYSTILKEELIPAMGCTEPIAIAYAGAIIKDTLQAIPDTLELIISGNIIKNVKSVIVPHTGGRKGIATAIAAGICYGRADCGLEVLSAADEAQTALLDRFLENTKLTIKESDASCPFDIQVSASDRNNTAYVRIIGKHTNVVSIRYNDKVLLEKPYEDKIIQAAQNRKLLTVKNIVEFAQTVDLEAVKDVLDRQIAYNSAIAQAGLSNNFGANIGSILLASYGDNIQNKAKAYAAAGSDARMNGCELPVVINSGSGNQGITASVPVIEYAKHCKASEELLYRALIVSNLVTIHLKTEIGCLSAYCGATSAGVGAGAGICYLYGGRYDEIAHTIVNALAINSGMVCDGAKASCAAKIASAVEAGLLGMQMYQHHSQFYGGDGIVAKGVENTIRAVSALARDGMRETDHEIIRLMTGDSLQKG